MEATSRRVKAVVSEGVKGPMLWIGAMVAAAVVFWSSPVQAGELVLEPRGREGDELIVDLMARDTDRLGSADLTVRFDPVHLGAPRVERGELSILGMMVDHVPQPGRLRIAFISPTGVSGKGALATLRFRVREDSRPAQLGLTGGLTDVDGRSIGSELRGATVGLASQEREAAAGAKEVGSREPERRESRPGEVDASSDLRRRREVVRRDPDPAETVRAQPAEEGPSGREEQESHGGTEGFDRRRFDPSAKAGGEGFEAEGVVRESVATREEAGAVREALADDREAANAEEGRALREADLAARLRGYKVVVGFEPQRAIAESAETIAEVHISFFRHGSPLAVEPSQVDLRAKGAEVNGWREAAEGDELVAELRVEREALPARLDLRALGLWEQRWVPVYPSIDPDLDGSGSLSLRDLLLMRRRVGAERGSPRYEEKLDLVRDGKIDDEDYSAFEFILVDRERDRRLEGLRRTAESGEETR